MALAFVFPGQGSQAPGMGRDLAAAFVTARHTFQEVDDALGQNLARLMFEGQAEDLTLTANAQPALLAHSLAVLRVLTRDGAYDLAQRVACVAGHSLGEYSALTAAGGFDLPTAARLLRKRGDAMQAATPPGTGAMCALLGAELDQARALAAAAAPDPDTDTVEVLDVANDNGGGQVVLSGHAGAVARAIAAAPEHGIKRALPLPVSAPFHSALMAPAADVMAEALAATTIAPLAVPVVANVTAAAEQAPDAIRALLVRQVTATVRWRECVAAMVALGCDRFVELGTGRVLTGLAKRNAPDATASAIGTPAEVEAFLRAS